MKLVALVLLLAFTPATDKGKGKLNISVKASPAVAFSPARVVVTADIKGGPEDSEELYCPSVEWVWGDGTTSDHTTDCEPYVAGKSEIKRHFTADRVFETSGDFRVEFRLKRKDKTIGLGSTMVKIRPGVREIGG